MAAKHNRIIRIVLFPLSQGQFFRFLYGNGPKPPAKALILLVYL